MTSSRRARASSLHKVFHGIVFIRQRTLYARLPVASIISDPHTELEFGLLAYSCARARCLRYAVDIFGLWTTGHFVRQGASYAWLPMVIITSNSAVEPDFPSFAVAPGTSFRDVFRFKVLSARALPASRHHMLG